MPQAPMRISVNKLVALWVALLLALATSAGCLGAPLPDTMLVTDAPRTVVGSSSDLVVPRRCRIYTPNGGDNRSAGPPFESPVLFGCGVDSQGGVYGLVPGDDDYSYRNIAVILGDREIGVFMAFDHTMFGRAPTPATITGSDGDLAQVRAWAAPLHVHDGYPEDLDDGTVTYPGDDHEIPLQVVAVGQSGVLLSLGHFDGIRLQVSLRLLWDRNDGGRADGYLERFYVNGAPDERDVPCKLCR
jgi:hypothetical protein